MKINADPDFSVAHLATDRYEIEIDEDGSVMLEGDCTCGHWCKILISLDELAQIAREGKVFCAARTQLSAAKEAQSK